MPLEETLEAIENADKTTIDLYLDAVLNRKRKLCPQCDICYLALPFDAPERKRELLNALKIVWNCSRDW